MGLHCSDAAYELLSDYVPDAQCALYACYFLVKAWEHAVASVFPTDCDAVYWVAKGLHPDADVEELRPLKEQIRASGFLSQLVESSKPLLRVQPARVREYRLTPLGEELAKRLQGMMEC